MKSTLHPSRSRAAALAALLAAALLGGVATVAALDEDPRAPDEDARSAATAEAPAFTPRLDGATSEWPAEVDATVDDRFVVLKVDAGEAWTLQGGERTSTLRLDVDANPRTGAKLGELGVDVEVVFSPPSPQRGKPPRNGIEVRVYDDLGTFTDVGHAKLRFAFAPTYASGTYEMRFARAADLPEPAGSRLRASRRLVGAFATEDRVLDRFELALPAPVPFAPRADARVPDRGAGPRVVSWNVEWQAPEKTPAPFGRVLRALAPDVILIQEWRTQDGELEAWFSANVPSDEPWRAHTFGDLGVAVVARHPLRPLQDERLMPARAVDGKDPRPIRFVAAHVELPSGPLVAASLHLKCCGSGSTWEDELRCVEAEAIREFLAGHAREVEAPVVVGGDCNLVGTREPLEVLAAGGDLDGSDLVVADAAVVGDDAAWTWTKDSARFSPGRLDFALVGDAGLRVESAFVLDSAWLPPAELERTGLRPDDTAASDHRPLVVDLAPASGGGAAAGDESASRLSVEPKTAEELRRIIADSDADAVLVNFWATWCVPCIAEMPDLLAVVEEYGERVELVLVSCDFPSDRDAARERLAEFGVDRPTYLKEGKDQAFIDGVDPEWNGTLPATFVHDGAGRRVAFHVGRASREDFRAWIERALDDGD